MSGLKHSLCKQMLRILLILLGIKTIISRHDTCRTPFMKPGKCVSLLKCDVLLNLLKSHTNIAGNYLRDSLCYYENHIPVICCPVNTNIILKDSHTERSEDPVLTTAKLKLIDIPLPPVCGFSNTSHGRVVGGAPAEKGAWPWIAALGYRFNVNEDLRWNCGGTLISNRHILTAAHCAHSRSDLVMVRLGDHDLYSDEDGANPVDIDIHYITIHPLFSPVNYTNDVAILRLARGVHFTSTVHPICLPLADNIRFRNLVRHYPFVAGWGSLYYNGPTSTSLQELQIPIIDNRQCELIFKNIQNTVIDHRVLCAGFAKGGRDACQGDSGGPLMLPFGSTFYVIGIVSYGYRCAEPGFPGVYTRVTSFINFITNNIV